jgi:asparagine N-glycosylation enzyme membrane subunit Stt3
MITRILAFLFGDFDPKDIKRKEELKETALEISKQTLKQYNKQKDGYVYVISNPAWKGWYKVGMAVDSQDRCGSYQTSSPYRDYRLEFSKYFLNRKVAEEIAHDVIGEISLDRNGEWFKVHVNRIRKIIKGIDYEISA